MQIKVSEHWMDGFVKAAEAAGIPQDKVPGLFKLSQQLDARSTNPAAFDEGFNKAAAGFWSTLGKSVPWLGGAALGGAAMQGAGDIFGKINDERAQTNMIQKLMAARQLQALHKTQFDLMRNAPGVYPPYMQGGGGYGARPYGMMY